MDCQGCVYYYYERDTGYKTCENPKFEDSWLEGPDDCPHWYSREDAKADAKYGHCDRY